MSVNFQLYGETFDVMDDSISVEMKKKPACLDQGLGPLTTVQTITRIMKKDQRHYNIRIILKKKQKTFLNFTSVKLLLTRNVKR